MPYAALVDAGGWVPGVMFASDFQALILRIASGIDGDNGGSYAPTNALRVSGNGFIFTDPPHWIEPQLRTIRSSTLEHAFDALEPTGALLATTATATEVLGIYAGGSLSVAFPMTRMPDDTTLVTAAVEFYVPYNKAAVVAVLPTLDIRRLNIATGVSESLASGPQMFPAPASLAAYVGTGAPNRVVFTPDPTKAVIDLATYVYWAIFTDEEVGGSYSNVISAIETNNLVTTMGHQ